MEIIGLPPPPARPPLPRGRDVARLTRPTGPNYTWASHISWIFCENKYLFWFSLVLLCLFVALAYAMHTSYRCWQWRTDPAGAALLEMRRLGMSPAK